MTVKKVPFLADLPNYAEALLRLKMLAARFTDIILPPHSLLTGQVLHSTDEYADTELWQHLKFLDEPCCLACGFPFDFEQGVDSLCGFCQARPPVFDKARAAVVYDDISRKLILDFKHGGRTDGLSFFAGQMVRSGGRILGGADILIPVPLHGTRLRQRRFNQSALLARAISKQTDIPYDTEILMRRKNTPSQGGQNFSQRRKNVAGAFNVNKRGKYALKGKSVVLIDDVFTTGSTLSACAKTLKRAGADTVDALTFMRVVRPAKIPT